jgi:hypothetical protein
MEKLNKNLFDITYNPQLECLMLIYKAYVKSEEFRKINELTLLEIGDKPFTCMLRDMRLLSNIPSADREWFKEEIAPRLVKKGLRFLAVVVPFAPSADNFFKEFFDYVMPESVVIEYFHHETEAELWLEETLNKQKFKLSEND